MKGTAFALLLTVSALALACQSDKPASEASTSAPEMTTDLVAADPAAAGASEGLPELAAPGATVSAPGGVQHYICPKNCAGSGGPAQANCPTCGTAYVHNQAFHAQPGAPPEPASANTPITMPAPGADKPAEPAQNAAGVWHYTCPKGCKGGGGAATPCASCGTALAHNNAYHQ
jgi:hypothetical protein